MARTISLRVHQFRGESAVVAREATAAIELCKEHGFVHYLAMAMILSGWASAQQGEFDKGIAEILSGLEQERATDALLLELYTLGLLADACMKNERYGQALEFLDQARSRLDEESSERFTRLRYIACLEKHICDRDEILIRRSGFCAKALRLRANRKPNPLNLKCA